MKEGWEYKTLGECCRITDFVSNGSFASLKQNVNYYYSPNYALLVRLADNSNNFDESKFVYTDKHGYDFTSKSHLNGGEIIMSNVGSVGSVFICPHLNMPMTLAPNTISIDTEYNKFYYYLFISPSFSSTLSEIVTKTTLKKFNKTNFKKLIVRVPTLLEEQRRIVSYLDSSFQLIDKIKEKAQKSLSEAKALFQSALAEAMEPKEGWEEKTLGEICFIARGGSPRPIKNFLTEDESGIPWIKIGDTEIGGKYIYRTKEKIKKEGIKSSRFVRKGDFLLSNSMSFGRPYILKTDGCIHDGWLVLQNFKDTFIDDFLYYLLSCKYVQNQFDEYAYGSTVRNLKTDSVSRVLVNYPPLPTQKQIVSHLDKLSSNVKQMEEKYQKMVEECDALKQAMLRDVFE